MDTEERVALLEKRLAEHDALIARLIAFAQSTPKGRLMLRLIGLS